MVRVDFKLKDMPRGAPDLPQVGSFRPVRSERWGTDYLGKHTLHDDTTLYRPVLEPLRELFIEAYQCRGRFSLWLADCA